MRKAILLTILLALSAPTLAQSPPGTDIYIVPLVDEAPSGPLRNLTSRAGYDNQPYFSTDSSRLLFTSQHGEQTDVFSVSLDTDDHYQVTRTQNLSEYSPTLRPGTQAITVVRVEEDGTQRIWQFDADGSEDAITEPDLQPVGYFDWFSENRFAAFVLGEPHFLVIKTIGEQPETIAEDIGRTVRRLPDGRIGYIDKTAEGWFISAVNGDGNTEILAPTLESVEDFAVSPRSTLFMGKGSNLYIWKGEWELIADWSDEGIDGISRLMVSPDGRHIALVANDTKE